MNMKTAWIQDVLFPLRKYYLTILHTEQIEMEPMAIEYLAYYFCMLHELDINFIVSYAQQTNFVESFIL